MMMVDEEMEDMMDGKEEVFTVHEIDLDYEFDACKYVDFCREESFADVREAEMWFEYAPDYPPSPFVAKLVLGNMSFLENVNVSPKGAVEEHTALHSYQASAGQTGQMSSLDATARGLTFYNHMAKNAPKEKLGPRMKSTLPRNSTLMKPTASQLAKQSKPHHNFGTRFNTFLLQTSDKSLNNSAGVETQAPKRQKLEGGQLHKIGDMKQPSSLVHKAPKKDGASDQNLSTKLKLTIPREPEFQTRQRIQMIRSRTDSKSEQGAYSFRARPLNRKILEAPSMPLPKKSTPRPPEFQEFHLKTAERSAQHASAVPSSSSHCSIAHKATLPRPSHYPTTSDRVNNDNGRPIRNLDEPRTTHAFKARPVNKKIFSSKGELGVSRSIKRHVTIPMEFKFESEKRIQIQHNPPVDLFSKLSLASQPANGTENLSQMTFTKGSKENRGVSSQQEHEVNTGRERAARLWPDQLHCGSDRIAVETGPRAGRWLGIR
uniref:TPX2 central domain-containing protein n=1 Tax=Kalanchoe fedtschenkoi TaxID=63787 RepID=A0A7N0U1X9_KALFE